jgi:anti-sigma regulatory factor (Ser/Thr protein kinase)
VTPIGCTGGELWIDIGNPMGMDGDSVGEVGDVQRVHSTWRFELRADPSEVRRARVAVAGFAGRRQLDDRFTDVLVLVTSELVSNAVRHAAHAVTVQLVEHDDRFTVLVADDGPGTPVRADPDPGAESGRGLVIVDGLATRWGTRPTVTGKTVWADLLV